MSVRVSTLGGVPGIVRAQEHRVKRELVKCTSNMSSFFHSLVLPLFLYSYSQYSFNTFHFCFSEPKLNSILFEFNSVYSIPSMIPGIQADSDFVTFL